MFLNLQCHDWELRSGFDPLSALAQRRTLSFVDCEGNSLRTPPPTLFNPLKDQLPAAERWKECLQGLAFRDPSKFIAGGLHDHLDQWDSLLDIVNNEQSVEVRKWLHDKVDIFDYFKPFKGNFLPEVRIVLGYCS